MEKSKTRLSPALDLNQRKKLTELLLLDTLEKVCTLKNSEIILVSSEKLKLPSKFDDLVILDEKNGGNGVNDAIGLANEYIKNNYFSESMIIPIDLPLLSIDNLKEVIMCSREFDEGICIVPSRRYDGTNLLLRKPNLIIDTFYDNNSFYNHIKAATEKKKIVKIFNFESLMMDLDVFEDILYILDICNKTEHDCLKRTRELKNNKSIVFLKEIAEDGSISHKKDFT